MAGIRNVEIAGNQLLVNFDDETKIMCWPTHVGFWLPSTATGGGGPVDPEDPEDPDNPGGGDPGGSGDIYNPWASYNVTGSWANHGSYSAGGIDYPLGYGTPLAAPAAGTLRTSGGSGDLAAGSVGAAGRRSILELDKSFTRKQTRETYPDEAEGPMVAIVFQHQATMGDAKHYAKGEILGTSGASANGSDYGGDVHLHVHGLDSAGNRLDFTKFV